MVRAIRYRPSLVHGTRTRILKGIGLQADSSISAIRASPFDVGFAILRGVQTQIQPRRPEMSALVGNA